MHDRNFLMWLHDRMEKVHGENPNVDYMAKLRSIAIALPAQQNTPNTASIEDLDVIRNSPEGW